MFFTSLKVTKCNVYVCVYLTEAPEEEYDARSLFERLQEQKDKKQEEYDEQFKFSKTPLPPSLSLSPSLDRKSVV